MFFLLTFDHVKCVHVSYVKRWNTRTQYASCGTLRSRKITDKSWVKENAKYNQYMLNCIRGLFRWDPQHTNNSLKPKSM